MERYRCNRCEEDLKTGSLCYVFNPLIVREVTGSYNYVENPGRFECTDNDSIFICKECIRSILS